MKRIVPVCVAILSLFLAACASGPEKIEAALLKPFNIDMVSIPGGSFRMGDLSGDGQNNEKPVHTVKVPSFKMSKHEITFTAWDACEKAGKCFRPKDHGWGRENQPVIYVSWNAVTTQFIPWLNETTGLRFRLPSEAEWEYAARAGSRSKYSWGDNIGSNRASCDVCGSYWDDRRPAPVGSFSANRFGLYDMHGNVSELTQDCRNEDYTGAPEDGSAWMSGDCDHHVKRGGDWYDKATYLRTASRTFIQKWSSRDGVGFRLVQD